uniref:Uncharacterized protein n=1 Tax=Chromera velia CCMP2878 TaxID=1169474 RepID=A0A0G4I056_9ALVE|eukprot:Cvel_1602.t1-p1 / transcript=Cvel_1602.t1 / gene=Cvel_1602 / organism=Chromera_velia_CCMP2878 / gene_product=hypothetical protein / transcript_product=hypothetical protein / location=Cvel_scaffold57:82161-83550(-) / protein_length=111 / sequence_SO=supercontig / SO=protein_coding / is_pseudo=false
MQKRQSTIREEKVGRQCITCRREPLERLLKKITEWDARAMQGQAEGSSCPAEGAETLTPFSTPARGWLVRRRRLSRLCREKVIKIQDQAQTPQKEGKGGKGFWKGQGQRRG